jgi:nitrate reductase NapAB chaperone NapD
MNLSSILVFTSPDNLPAVNTHLNALPGVDVHYQCQDTGRLVVIQEALDDESEMGGLQRIKSLPHVMAAEMVYHHIDNDAEADKQAPAQQNTNRGTLSWA